MSIRRRENHFNNLRRMVAARRTYTISKRWHRIGTYGAIALVLLTPIALKHQTFRNALGISAAAWVAVSVLSLEQIERRKHLKAVVLHEQFDRLVFDLPWNGTLAAKYSDFEVAHIHRTTPKRLMRSVADWYPTPDDADGPIYVLRCQQGNIQWSSKLHDAYRWIVTCVAVIGAAYVSGFAAADNVSLGTFILAAVLPSLPAMITAFNAFIAHSDAKQDGVRVDTHINDVMARSQQTAADAKEVQDRIFELRRTGPLVPDLIYGLTRSRLNGALTDMLGQPIDLALSEDT